MTEAIKNLLVEHTGEANSFDLSEAEFFIGLAFSEVERRAKSSCCLTVPPCDSHVGAAFKAVQLELLGKKVGEDEA